MKCTHDEAVRGLLAISRVEKNEMPGSIAKIFFGLRKMLQPAAEFETEQETKFVEENGGKISETGKVTFDEPDKLLAFFAKQQEIRELEYEYSAPGKYVIDAAECGRIAPADMRTLEPFIDWKE